MLIVAFSEKIGGRSIWSKDAKAGFPLPLANVL